MRHLAINALALTGAIASLLAPAQAVTLGELAVESTLGQPLSARVPVTLQAGETLAENCISAPATAKPELGQLPQANIIAPATGAVGRYDLRITTTQALYEPMYELQLQVRCPGTALVVRQYVLMLDLPGAATVAGTAYPAPARSGDPADVAGIAAAPATSRPASRPQPARQRDPIENGVSYRVQSGDTLSTIAARISNRGGQSIWEMADRIHAANPQAFINGNPDLIKLGSEITVPAAVSASVPATAAELAPAAVLPEPARPRDPEARTLALPPEPAGTVSAMEPGQTAGAAALEDEAAPVTTDNGSVAIFQDEEPAEAGVAAAAESLEQPAAEPAVAIPAPEDRGTPAWLAALIGVLLGAAASLLLLRDRLLGALRGLKPGSRPVISPLAPLPVEKPAPAPAPVITGPRREPSMVVEESHPDADAAPVDAHMRAGASPAAVPAAEITAEQEALDQPAMDSDLSSLFGDHATGELPDSIISDDLPSPADLDLDLSAATPDTPVDEDIGWIGDETVLTPTQEMPQGASTAETVEHIDLATMSQRAMGDTQISQTLRDALNLLESDYEDELTASQVIDQKKLKEIMDDSERDGTTGRNDSHDDGDDDTLVRTGTDQFPRR